MDIFSSIRTSIIFCRKSILKKIGFKLVCVGSQKVLGDTYRQYCLEMLPNFTADILWRWLFNDLYQNPCIEGDTQVTDFPINNRKIVEKIGFDTQPSLKPWPEAELNRRHEDFQSSALPTELSGLVFRHLY